MSTTVSAAGAGPGAADTTSTAGTAGERGAMSTGDGTGDTGALLEAGAVLLPGAHRGEDADDLTARAYTHPVLEGRTVVRLVPGTLGDAEDLVLDFLGLRRESVRDGLGQVRRETLGFPAWALVNDPENGHHALALVKDVERLARMAKTRAGAAKDGFEELGERLGRSVPHFLPTFYEEAGRAFLRHENTTYAAALFGKAREAERVHSLVVDEQRQRAVFLEFAFAGALTVKALKDHVRDLTQRLAPQAAWEQYRRLIVERCGAGVPPYAALPQDARKLIKAAGLDRVEEECRLLADLLASPAVVRAPGTFWTAYRPTLLVLAAQEPAVRKRLLEIMPTGFGHDNGSEGDWLELLAETGAEQLLTDPAPDAAVDAGDWLSRWSTHLKGGWRGLRRSPMTYDLVQRMAARLRAEGRPVDLFRGRGWRSWADLDLIDVCLASGVAVVDPAPRMDGHGIGLDDWFGGPDTGRSDLAAVAADARFRPLLKEAIGGNSHRSVGSRKTLAVAEHPVLRPLLAEWLTEQAEAFTAAAGLPGARSALQHLRRFRSVAADVAPDAVARVRAHDLSGNLGRTLRAGIVDELGWPALEEAMKLLGPVPEQRHGDGLTVQEAWPALIVAHRDKAVVAGPDGILLEHDLRIPGKPDHWRQPAFRFVGGELLVTWWHEGKQRAYWSSRPADVFQLGGESATQWRAHTLDASLPLPDGGRSTGARPLHAGDTTLSKEHRVSGDGVNHWRLRTTSTASTWIEYDAATGATGRASLPQLLAGAVRDEGRLRHADCQVLPLQAGLENSPLGTDGTVLGRWVRSDGPGDGTEERLTAGTPDGREVALPARFTTGTTAVPLGALRLPGGAEPVLALDGHQLGLYANGAGPADGSFGDTMTSRAGAQYAAGTPLVPPASFWHAMRARDEDGSKALRAFADEQAAALADDAAAALAQHRRKTTGEARTALTDEQKKAASERFDRDLLAATERALPAIGHPSLYAGVGAITLAMVQLRESVAEFTDPQTVAAQPAAARRLEMFHDFSPRDGDDQALLSAIRGVLGHTVHGYWSPGTWSTLRQIKSVGHVIAGKAAEGTPLPGGHDLATLTGGWTTDELTIPSCTSTWLSVLRHLPALAYRATVPGMDETDRSALLHLLDAVAEGALADPDRQLRSVELREKGTYRPRPGQVLRLGDRTVAILAAARTRSHDDEVDWLALDHDPSGEFGPVAHFITRETQRIPGALPGDRIASLAALVRERGATPWHTESATALAAAPGCGPVQAALLLAGRPSGVLADDAASAECQARSGLTRTQVEAGHDRLTALTWQGRVDVVTALLPETVADLWETGPAVEAARAVWTERFGTLVRLPEDVEISLNGISTIGNAEAVLNPRHTPWISRTTVQRLGADGRLTGDDATAVPHVRDLVPAVSALGALAYGLPYGHPLRAALPGALDALRTRLADPQLLLQLGLAWTEKGGATAPELRKAHGMPETGGAGADGLTRVGEAFVVHPWHQQEAVLLRPAGLTGPDDPALGLIEGLAGSRADAPLRAIRAVLGDGLGRAVTAGVPGVDGPGAGGPVAGLEGYAQDPTRSVPGLVTEVAETHGIGEDAAALYLQLLALPDPTDRNSTRWTGWKPARMKKARAELAATAMVVEAKRTRAGRGLFLPGAWLALKAPALPVEPWKRDLYDIPGHTATVPLLPVPELFTRAWDRVRAGDVPAFEELTTRATRKGRRR
ncbi:hypothetical protein ACFVZD_09455 [Streptomyces sp. NPDC058287]|uniref:hypothetical protein n=1 Tax=unclassified Streptomyces TaxID=2593676 RepID=UPI0036EE457F